MGRKTLPTPRRVPPTTSIKLTSDRLSNAKPSAIFALKGKSQPTSITDQSPTITLGISIEPLSAVEVQLQSLHSAEPPTTMALTRPVPPITAIAQRIAKNLFNYLGSFVAANLPAGVLALGGLRADVTYVPLKAFEEWWSKFNRKIETDPGFLERDSD
jgi:hypothetical protein